MTEDQQWDYISFTRPSLTDPPTFDDYVPYQCGECFSLVKDIRQHTGWHQRMFGGEGVGES